MLEWLTDIVPNAYDLENLFGRAKGFGMSNPFVVNISTTPTYVNSGAINIFGANVNRFLPNQGNQQIDVVGKYTVLSSYGYSDYTENAFLANTMQAPFQLGILRVETNSPSQFVAQNNVISYIQNEPTGERKQISIPLFKRLNQYQNDAVEFDLSSHKIIIDGDMQMQFFIKYANTSLKFYFYPTAKASYKILLQTGFIAQTYSYPSLPLSSDYSAIIKPKKLAMTDDAKAFFV